MMVLQLPSTIHFRSGNCQPPRLWCRTQKMRHISLWRFEHLLKKKVPSLRPSVEMSREVWWVGRVAVAPRNIALDGRHVRTRPICWKASQKPEFLQSSTKWLSSIPNPAMHFWNTFFCKRLSKLLENSCSGERRRRVTLVMAFSYRSSPQAWAEGNVSSLIANAETPSFRKVFSLHFMSIWYLSDYIVCTISSSRLFVGYTTIRTGSEEKGLFRRGHGVSSSLNACKRSAYP